MAIGASKRGSVSADGRQVSAPASVYSEWFEINDDLTTAQGSGDRLSPFSINDAGFHWVEVPQGATRAMWCARTVIAAGMSSTSTVRIIGADVTPSDAGAYVTGQAHFTRIDNVSPAAGGITIAQATTSTGFFDGTYVYGPPTSLTPTDLLGCRWVGMLVESAATQSGSGAIAGMVRFLN